jgi:hypothetical protein
MSDKLVVEFYESRKDARPAFAILSFHGGDNPVSASLTISDFLSVATGPLPTSGQNPDVYQLASQFIFWSSMNWPPITSFRNQCLEAELIPVSNNYAYQTVRIFADSDGTSVQIVPDEFTTDEEMFEGNILLGIYCSCLRSFGRRASPDKTSAVS